MAGDALGLAAACRCGEAEGTGPIKRLVGLLEGGRGWPSPAKPIHRLEHVIPRPFCIRGDLPREIPALKGYRRNEPRRQPAQGEKGNGEEQRDCLGATKGSARHFCHERIEQIAKNHGDRHRDQDWLEETGDTGSSPDDGSKNHQENNDEARSQRRPHHFALPEGGVFLHLSISNSNVPKVRSSWIELRLGRSMFSVRRSI